MADKITAAADGTLNVPDQPIIPFIEGDGTGPDIWPRPSVVLRRRRRPRLRARTIAWMEVLAGEKAFNADRRLAPRRHRRPPSSEFLVGIKGPLTTPVGGGIRSLNVALRQILDLYVCLRPVRWFQGVPSPVKHPEKVDMVIFRENTEDIYAGIEYAAGTPEAPRCSTSSRRIPQGFEKIRFGPPTSGESGIKPGARRRGRHRQAASIACAAIDYAIQHNRKSVTLVHKGNIMKFTEGAFRDWGYKVAKDDFGAVEIDGGPWCKIPDGKPGAGIVIKDAIADITLQQVLTRPEDFDVIATLNLNGDYLSDALAAQVGGIGIAPGGNINYVTGHAIFEATHGTAPKYANQDNVNPGSVHPLRRHDARIHGLAGSRRPDRQGPRTSHRRQDRHLRLRPPHGRRRRSSAPSSPRPSSSASSPRPLRVRRWSPSNHLRTGSARLARRLESDGLSDRESRRPSMLDHLITRRHRRRRHRRARVRGRRRGARRPHRRPSATSTRTPTERVDAAGLLVSAGLRRPAHALRRPALLGPVRHAVERPRRHHRHRRQLRLHPRAAARPGDADYTRRMMAKVEGMPLAALEQGVDWSWETLRRVPRPRSRATSP